jgi:DNA-binding NtrC family response regulator
MSRRSFDTSFVTGQPLRMLLVEHDEVVAERVVRTLVDHGYSVQADVVSSMEEFLGLLSHASYPLVVAGAEGPSWRGTDILDLLAALPQETPCIVLTGALNERAAARWIDQGADDFVYKDRLARLPLAVRRVLREQRLLDDRRRTAAERERLIEKLQASLAEVRRLQGLLPVCVTCKRVRGIEGDWSRIESFIEQHSEARVSPSLCPLCAGPAVTGRLN